MSKNYKQDAAIGMPRGRWGHEEAIRSFVVRTERPFRKIGLLVRIESTPTEENLNDIVPDLTIVDYRNDFRPLAFIEITRPDGVNRMIRKCKKNYFVRFPNAACFVYDYINKVVYAYDDSAQAWISSETHDILCPFIDKPMLPLFQPYKMPPALGMIC